MFVIQECLELEARCQQGLLPLYARYLAWVCVVQECLELQVASTRCAGGGSAESSVDISGAGVS